MIEIILHSLIAISVCPAGHHSVFPIWGDAIGLNGQTQRQRAFLTPDFHELVYLRAESKEPDARLVPHRVRLFNWIIPKVHVRVAASPSGGYRYEYMVGNDSEAKDSIGGIVIYVANLFGSTATAELNGNKNLMWSGTFGTAPEVRDSELKGVKDLKCFLWVGEWDEEHSEDPQRQILPGSELGGLVLRSPLLPGFTTAIADSVRYGYPRILDDDVADQQIGQLHLEDYLRVTTVTFGPMLAPGAGFSEIVTNYKEGLARLKECAAAGNLPFLNEVSAMLENEKTAKALFDRLAEVKSKPTRQIEVELINCLRLALAIAAKT